MSSGAVPSARGQEAHRSLSSSLDGVVVVPAPHGAELLSGARQSRFKVGRAHAGVHEDDCGRDIPTHNPPARHTGVARFGEEQAEKTRSAQHGRRAVWPPHLLTVFGD